ncbi:MAG TPA: histidinol-phosphate transaminase [Candidatus Manganitrophaceae bacterium]|nr:histidinol-phosphate transaminase [Candidatus Manganitrophaceae bacterium]
MIKVSPDIAGITPYPPGKPMEELEREWGIQGSIKLASNENPLGPSRRATAAIRAGLKKLHRYPDGAGYYLREALAEKWKVPPAQVMIGNGSNEIIELLVRTFILPGDEAVMARPSFSLYRLMITAGHGKPVEVPLKEGRHDLAAMAKAVTPKTKLLFICNPNNPTGTIVRKEEMARFLARVPKRVLVVVDEAYAEYATDPLFPQTIELLRDGAPLVMLRTFSKIYGLAGLRIGYGIGRPEVADYVNRVRQPFNTNLPAQQAALAALSDEAHVSRSLKVNREGKAFLCRQFDAMGIAYLPSETNFIYFDLSSLDPGLGKKIYTALLQKGVIVRHFGGTEFRVTIGLQKENRRFVRSLKEVLGGKL